MHILVFPGWYPGRNDKLSGDFIQRHLHSLSLYCRVSVVLPVKDQNISKAEQVKVSKGNITEYYYYYPSVSSIKWIDGLVSFVRYNYRCLKAAKQLSTTEKVSLTYLYVLQKNHFTGLLLKWFYKIPYVISEQSTLYIDGQWEKLSWVQKEVFRYSFLNASSFHAVSNFLLLEITKKLQLKKQGVVIANVVDTNRFYLNKQIANSKTTFVHVSNMVYQKNIEGMLQAFAEAKKVNENFIVNLVGPAPNVVRDKIKNLGLDKQMILWNERSYDEVAEIMQQSDVFVFFTRYETFGCVIIEANACGLPVIISDLAVTRELIKDQVNGLFVQSENVKDLAEKILQVINNPTAFDPVAISAENNNKFNYERIGKQLFNWLSNVSSQNANA